MIGSNNINRNQTTLPMDEQLLCASLQNANAKARKANRVIERPSPEAASASDKMFWFTIASPVQPYVSRVLRLARASNIMLFTVDLSTTKWRNCLVNFH